MADYHFPTVVSPFIPAAAMTPLEWLVLSQVFEVEEEDGDVYFYSSSGPSDMVTLRLDDLREACDASRGPAGSVIGAHAEVLIAALDAKAEAEDEVDLDLSIPEIGWDRILQDIVRRFPALDEIFVMAAFICTKMRPDGFGGSVMLITSYAIGYRSTTRMIDMLRAKAALPSPADNGGRQIVARLDDLAASAGWDPFDLTLRISAWAERHGYAAALTDHLAGLAAGEMD